MSASFWLENRFYVLIDIYMSTHSVLYLYVSVCLWLRICECIFACLYVQYNSRQPVILVIQLYIIHSTFEAVFEIIWQLKFSFIISPLFYHYSNWGTHPLNKLLLCLKLYCPFNHYHYCPHGAVQVLLSCCTAQSIISKHDEQRKPFFLSCEKRSHRVRHHNNICCCIIWYKYRKHAYQH